MEITDNVTMAYATNRRTNSRFISLPSLSCMGIGFINITYGYLAVGFCLICLSIISSLIRMLLQLFTIKRCLNIRQGEESLSRKFSSFFIEMAEISPVDSSATRQTLYLELFFVKFRTTEEQFLIKPECSGRMPFRGNRYVLYCFLRRIEIHLFQVYLP